MFSKMLKAKIKAGVFTGLEIIHMLQIELFKVKVDSEVKTAMEVLKRCSLWVSWQQDG